MAQAKKYKGLHKGIAFKIYRLRLPRNLKKRAEATTEDGQEPE